MHSTAYAHWRWGVMSTVFHTLRQASDFSYQKKGVLGSNVVLCSSSCSRTFLMGFLAQLWATRLCCPSEVLLFSSDVVWDPGAHQPARPHPLLSSAVLPQAIQGFQSHIPLCKQVIPQSCTISLTLRDPSLLMTEWAPFLQSRSGSHMPFAQTSLMPEFSETLWLFHSCPLAPLDYKCQRY